MWQALTPNLMTDDVEATIEFYQKLGFTVVNQVPNETTGRLQFVILTRDNLYLMFQERSNLIAEVPQLAAPTGQVPTFTLYIRVTDLAQVWNDLEGHAEIIVERHQTFYGSQEFACLDNNGYVLAFSEQN